MPELPRPDSFASLLGSLGRLTRRPKTDAGAVERQASRWLRRTERRKPGHEPLLEALAWAHALPAARQTISTATWQAMLDLLSGLARSGRWLDSAGDLVECQLAAGELGLTLACLLSNEPKCRRLLAESRRILAAGLGATTCGGAIRADCWPLVGPLTACWTRCLLLDAACGKCGLAAQLRKQMGQWLLAAFRSARPDGNVAFACGREVDERCGMLLTAQRLLPVLDACRTPTVRSGKSGAGSRRSGEGKCASYRPAAANETAKTAVLRCDWSRRSPRLTLLYHGSAVQTELSLGGGVLWSGGWECEVSWNGQLLAPIGSWREVCWVSDRDADYVELQLELERGWIVQRQALLPRKDRFVYLADAVLGRRLASAAAVPPRANANLPLLGDSTALAVPGNGRPNRPSSTIAYRASLPLADGTRGRAAADTRECSLALGGVRATAIPLALPEWRSKPSGGELTVDGGRLCMRHTVAGRNALFPLWIDLDPRRSRSSRTWRQLTVAENRNVVAGDAAAGYRVMAGVRQWLFYRALSRQANRTLLGHNLSIETLAARFTSTGQVEPLLQVE